MVWDSIPNFDDENAKISESVHELSGCRRFDVLYGGRDSLTGASISPKSKADGHGHFILLEVDGELHPFSDRNPVSTGGQHEFGTDRRDTPLSDLEDYLKSNPQKTASDYLSENFSPAERQSANAVYISNSSNVADLTVRVRQIKQVAKGQMTLARHTTANLFSSQRQIAQLTRPSRSGDEITLELINAAKALDDFSYALNHLCDACDMFIFDLEG